MYILLGVRNDWVSLDDRSAANVDSSQHKFTWRLGANYVLDNGLAPCVGYARSFEPVLGSDTTTDPANPRPFKPSSGQQTEDGVKFTSPDNRDIKLSARQRCLTSSRPTL